MPVWAKSSLSYNLYRDFQFINSLFLLGWRRIGYNAWVIEAGQASHWLKHPSSYTFAELSLLMANIWHIIYHRTIGTALFRNH